MVNDDLSKIVLGKKRYYEQYEQYEKRFWCSIYNKGWIPVLFSEHVFFQLQVL